MSWTPTAILGISQRVGDEGVKFRVMAGTTYVGCCSSMKEAKTLLLDAGVALCSRTKPAEEVELFRAVYPLFADWMPSDYLTHQAALTKTAARDIRHSPAVYQLWIRGAMYDALLESFKGNQRMFLEPPYHRLPKNSIQERLVGGGWGRGRGDGGGHHGNSCFRSRRS